MAVAPPDRIRLKLTYEIPYQDATANPSCNFYLTTSTGAHTPTNQAAWQALADDLVLYFKTTIGTFATINAVTCYGIGSDMPLYSFSYAQAGTQVKGDSPARLPSQCAQLLKWTTTGRTAKNHPIYLFNYVHGQWMHPDYPDASNYRTDVQTFGARLAAGGAGITDGTTTYHKSSRTGQAAQVSIQAEYVTDHNLFT